VELEIDHRERRIWVVEGGGLKRTEFPHRVSLVTLSPRRDLVVFALGDGNMYVSRLDGSAMLNLGRGCRWDWSQDGKRLVYLGAVQQDDYTVTAAEIYVVNADGSGFAQITDTPNIVEDYPTWSPDGMRIAYSTVNTGQICVAVLEEIE
jgi:Tol biopolymer transport system component